MKLLPRLLLLGCVALASCREDGPSKAREWVREVRTASWPITSLAEQLAPEDVPVRCSLPAGADPITWHPSRETVGAFQRARLIALNGAGLEGWIDHVSLPESRVVDASRVLESQLIELEETLHSHGPAGTHSHAGTDPHTFLDPALVAPMVGCLRDALQEAFPEHRAGIEERAARTLARIEAWQVALSELTRTLDGRQLLSAHAAYSYLARSQGWKLEDLGLDPGTALTDEQRSRLEQASSQGAFALLWEQEPLEETRAWIEEHLPLKSLVWDPCESPAPERELDFIDLQVENVRRLRAALDS